MDTAPFVTPDAEIAALRAQLAARDVLLAERDVALAERDAELRSASFEIEKLKGRLAALRRERFGKSSEKLAAEIGQLVMLIGDLEENQAQAAAAAEAKAQAAAAAEAKAKDAPAKPRRPAMRKPLPEHLPRETVLHEPVFACRCGSPMPPG